MSKILTFVLGGGGSRGALQAGALYALLESGLQPDLFVGTSIGAVNGTFLALHGFSKNGLDRLAAAWREAAKLDLPYRLQILALTLLGWLVIYFVINWRHVEPHRRLDLATSLDRRIPFVPAWALVYFSTYPFVLQPFIVLTEARQFYWTLAGFITITLTAHLFHAAIPSQIQRVEKLDNLGVSGWMIDVFQHICKPYDNFPSMHMGLSVPAVGAGYMAGGPVVGSLMLVWAVLIALSTLFTKQHYIWDVLAGALGGVVIYALMYWLIMV